MCFCSCRLTRNNRTALMIPPGQAMRRQIWLFPFDWCFHQTRVVVMISFSGRYVGCVPIIIYSNQSSGMVIHQLVWAQWSSESICPQIPPPSLRKLYNIKNLCLCVKNQTPNYEAHVPSCFMFGLDDLVFYLLFA